jgi:formate hydrogenlyase subunit 3/multisubunit Na+/H+ antiporter MnhD subunit
MLRNTDPPAAAVALLLLGFGIKLALPGLHLWLPHSYAAAPGAGVAVLSGPMMAAGFLGWLRFLPPGPQALVPWGEFLIVVGLFGSLYGVILGLLQDRPRLVLAYSSISKMGLLSAGFGIVLAYPHSTTLLLPALIFFTLHHLLVKSALFLAVDLLETGRTQAWIRGGLILLGLPLIGAPFTTGALAKTEIIAALPASFSGFSGWLSLAGLTTTLLMARLAYLVWKPRSSRPAIGGFGVAAWALLSIVILLLPWLITTPQASFSETLPFLAGLLLSGLVWRYRPGILSRLVGRIPSGDILQPLGRILRALRRLMAGGLEGISRFHSVPAKPTQPDAIGPADSSSVPSQPNTWQWAGPLWSVLAIAVLLALVLGYRVD